MADTFERSYNTSDAAALAEDIVSLRNWAAIEHEESSSEWIFYADTTKTKGLKITGTAQDIAIEYYFNGNLYFKNTSTGYLNTRFTKTSSAFVFEYKSAVSATQLAPENFKFIVCTGVNQVSGQEEPITIYVDESTSISNGFRTYIFSDDVSVFTYKPNDRLAENLGSKVTVLVPLFSRYSECIPKDIFTVSATQLTALSYGTATLNGRKYFMCGWVWVADE